MKKRKSPSKFQCPRCYAEKGEPCSDLRPNSVKHVLSHYHLERRLLVRRQHVDIDGYLSLQQVCTRLKVHRDTVRQWVKKNVFTTYKPAPNKCYISEDQISRFIAARNKARYRARKDSNETEN